MSNLNNLLIQALGYTTNTGEVTNNTALNKTYSTTSNNKNFAVLLAQLEKNLSVSQIDTGTSSTTGRGYCSVNANQTSTMPSISAIVQKIKDNDNSMLSIDDQVSQYLLDNYGGSKSGVILTLSGAQSLPAQMTVLQNQVFQTIVSKISSQVRNNLYTGQDTDVSSESTDIDTGSYDPSVSSDDVDI